MLTENSAPAVSNSTLHTRYCTVLSLTPSPYQTSDTRQYSDTKQPLLLSDVSRRNEQKRLVDTSTFQVSKCGSVTIVPPPLATMPSLTLLPWNHFLGGHYGHYCARQAPDKFNPKVTLQTCGIIQMLYETRHIKTMMFGKSVMAHFSKIEPKTSK